MKAWDIVGYTYRADIWCPSCIVGCAKVWGGTLGRPDDAEEMLDACAKIRGIDREDERSFDSDDFPKVIFASDVDDCEFCGECGDCLIGGSECRAAQERRDS